MKRFGVMIDCSRNSVMTVDALKRYINYLSKFGYNMIMLYTEDTYEVNNEPFFGYRRGKYTKLELKEIDKYCSERNVELIPCIQTLAHLNTIFRWDDYAQYKDIDDILLTGEERVYTLINNMFETINECFTSKYVHIGMDEAHHLGLGKYLDKNGFTNRFEILSNHLNRVIEISKKYNKQCIMWSDMFFRLATQGDYYDEKNTFKATDEIKNSVNKDVGLIYWDYYHKNKKTYDDMINKHKELSNNELWFAGGAWTWIGFAPHNTKTLDTMIPAMKSCRENGIENIIITEWGDNGGECSKFSTLASLFYIKCVYDGIEDKEVIKQKFQKTTGESYDDMFNLELPNIVTKDRFYYTNPSKYILFSDLFNVYFEDGLADSEEKKLKKNSNILKRVNSKEFSYLFDTLSKLTDVVAYKYTLAKRIRQSYKQKNIEEMKVYIKQIDILIKKIKAFYNAFKKQWFLENKPNGFDIQDIRIGGLIFRLTSCRDMLVDYVNGKINNILELDEDLLPIYIQDGKKRNIGVINDWKSIVSVNNI